MLSSDVCQRLLLICPHPDDETLGAGLLLQEALVRGASVRVVYLTDGERNPIAQFLFEERWPFRRGDRLRFGATRRAESVQALRTLGVSPASADFWQYPDQGVAALASLIEGRLTAFLAEWQPTLVVAPSPRDLHADHHAAAWITRRAVAASGLHPLHLTYRVHGDVAADLKAWVGSGSGERQKSKMQAIAAHKTQLLATGARMLQMAAREEVLREWSDEVALPPVRFRGLQRLWHLLPQPAPPPPEAMPELIAEQQRQA